MIDFESELGAIPRRNRHINRFRARTLRPYRSERDPEMGFLPLLAAAVPMVTSLAGSLLSKKGKSGNPPPEAGQAKELANLLTNMLGQDASKGETSIKDVVSNIVRTIPSPVIGQVKTALAELKASQNNNLQKRISLVNAIDSKLGPKVVALLAGVKAANLQKQATYEHNKLKSKAQFRTAVKSNLTSISNRLDAIDQRLNRSAIVQGKTRIALLGGRNVLER